MVTTSSTPRTVRSMPSSVLMCHPHPAQDRVAWTRFAVSRLPRDHHAHSDRWNELSIDHAVRRDCKRAYISFRDALSTDMADHVRRLCLRRALILCLVTHEAQFL